MGKCKECHNGIKTEYGNKIFCVLDFNEYEPDAEEKCFEANKWVEEEKI